MRSGHKGQGRSHVSHILSDDIFYQTVTFFSIFLLFLTCQITQCAMIRLIWMFEGAFFITFIELTYQCSLTVSVTMVTLFLCYLKYSVLFLASEIQ